MEPIRETRATLVDLLDRVFDKGVVLYADVIISVAGIPLIGLNLRAALAGMETMLEYGMLQDWDAKARMWETQHRRNKEVSLRKGEEVILNMFGSYYYNRGIYKAWKSGRLYLTNTRLFLYQQDFAEVVFETPLDEIRAIAVRSERSFTGKDKDIIYLTLEGKRIVRLNVLETKQFKQKLQHLVEKSGVTLDGELPSEEFDERANCFLVDGEKIFCSGKMWHAVQEGGVIGETWKPGYLYLTNERLCWWYDFQSKMGFQIPIDEISAAAKERRDLSTILKDKKVLDVIYNVNGTRAVASFAGKEVDEWEKVLNRTIAGEGQVEENKEKETCPRCGEEDLAKTLLKKGCPHCGWVSPKLEKKVSPVMKMGT